MFKATFESFGKMYGEAFAVVVEENRNGFYRIFVAGGILPDGLDEWISTENRETVIKGALALVEDIENSD